MNVDSQTLRRSPSTEQLKLQNLRLRVGEHIIDVGALRVIGGDNVARVTAKALAVLLELVRHAGNTVSREALLDTVWKDRVTTPDVLTQAIKELRRAFDSGGQPSHYIETIPKVGYRLLAQVSVIEAGEVPLGQFGAMPLYAENELWIAADAEGPVPVVEPAIPAAAVWLVPALAAARTAPVELPRSRLWLLPAALLMVAAVAALYFAGIEQSSSPVPRWLVSDLRALTSDKGVELLPHISPDGTRVAFSELVEATGFSRLFIRAVEPSQLVALAPHSGAEHDVRPAWSPDGSRIAYERAFQDKCTLYIVSSLGGHEREIGDCQDFGWGYFDFTPDGQELLVTSRADGPHPDLTLQRLSIATGVRQPLRYAHADGDEDLQPHYSPDGRWLAFRRGILPYGDLYLMRADGSGLRRLTHLVGNFRGYTWTADSSALVFASNHHGKFELYAVGTDGGALQRLGVEQAVFIEQAVFPEAARAAATVVYQIQRATSALAEVDLNVPTAAPRKLATSTGNDGAPTVSPDGSRIAFLSDRSGYNQVWLYDRAADSAEAVTDYRDVLLSDLVWRADSAALLVTVREEPAASRLVEIDLASHRAHDVSARGENVLFGGYGAKPDSFLLAIGASSREARLLQREHAGTPGQTDETLTSGVQHAAADAAHGLVYYTRPGGGGLFRRAASGGEEERETDKIGELTSSGWRIVDGKFWYLTQTDMRVTTLHEFDPDRNADRVIANLPISVDEVNFDVDPQHRHLYLGLVSELNSNIGAFELKRADGR